MIVGIITGTYSSVFIAAAIVVLWRGQAPPRRRRSAPATAPVRKHRQARARLASKALGQLQRRRCERASPAPAMSWIAAALLGVVQGLTRVPARSRAPRISSSRAPSSAGTSTRGVRSGLRRRAARRHPRSPLLIYFWRDIMAMISPRCPTAAARRSRRRPRSPRLIVIGTIPDGDRRRRSRRSGWRRTCGRRTVIAVDAGHRRRSGCWRPSGSGAQDARATSR